MFRVCVLPEEYWSSVRLGDGPQFTALLGSTVDTVLASVLAISCSVSVLLEEYAQFGFLGVDFRKGFHSQRVCGLTVDTCTCVSPDGLRFFLRVKVDVGF